MLLEMDDDEILALLENQDSLTTKINEAIAVLNEFSQKETPTA